ncbi:MAG: YlmC/YmxH family sporulation protein [Christensenellaceae bacterium]|jgi:YlmC/YmxH family sporulation protein|nr:YlmC/YmxH family sporulation protein [Christensenellaceae bacterium]
MQGIDYTFCELRDKEVINIADGKQLGKIVDLGLHCGGRIHGIIVPGEKRFLKTFVGGDSIYIPWVCLVKIGDDVILVNMPSSPPITSNDLQKY